MKISVAAAFLWGSLLVPCLATDHLVLFLEEIYRETRAADGSPNIYHSFQVLSEAGPKLIVLEGRQPGYRRWLRECLKRDRIFIVQVPDDRNDLFVDTGVFHLDVGRIHPFHTQSESETAAMAQSILDAGNQSGPPGLNRRDAAPETEPSGEEGESQEDLAAARAAAEAARALEEERRRRLRAQVEDRFQETSDRLAEAENRWRAAGEDDAYLKRALDADKRWLARLAELRARERQARGERDQRKREAELRWIQEKMAQLLEER